MNRQTLFTRVVFIGAFGIALWIGTVSYRFFQRTGMIQSEIHELESEAKRINQENATLREKIEYFSSPSFKEREAKDKLGLKKIDEQVIVVKAPVDTEERVEASPLAIIGTGRVAEFHAPNYVKWWRMMFGNQRPL
jgi:cell division protein FtsB